MTREPCAAARRNENRPHLLPTSSNALAPHTLESLLLQGEMTTFLGSGELLIVPAASSLPDWSSKV